MSDNINNKSIDIWDQANADKGLILTKDKMDELINVAASGASNKDVAWAAGVQPALFNQWLSEGRKLQDRAYKDQRLSEVKGAKAKVTIERLYEFYIAFEQSKARERIKVLERLKAAGPHYATEHSHKIVGQWQAAEAWLIRTSDEYLDKDRLMRSKNAGFNINISLEQIRKDLDKLDDPALLDGDYKVLEDGS